MRLTPMLEITLPGDTLDLPRTTPSATIPLRTGGRIMGLGGAAAQRRVHDPHGCQSLGHPAWRTQYRPGHVRGQHTGLVWARR